MKIVRNGEIFTLTDSELAEARTEHESFCHEQQIKARIRTMVESVEIEVDHNVYPNGKLSGEALEDMVYRLLGVLDNDDTYLSCYKNAVKEVILSTDGITAIK